MTPAIAEVTVRELAQLFRCHAVFMTDEDGPQPLASAPAGAALAPSDFAAAAVTLDTGEPTGRGVRKLDLADWQFRPIIAGSGVMAAVGMARDDGVPPVAEDQIALLGNLLDQVALALERARLEREARGRRRAASSATGCARRCSPRSARTSNRGSIPSAPPHGRSSGQARATRRWSPASAPKWSSLTAMSIAWSI